MKTEQNEVSRFFNALLKFEIGYDPDSTLKFIVNGFETPNEFEEDLYHLFQKIQNAFGHTLVFQTDRNILNAYYNWLTVRLSEIITEIETKYKTFELSDDILIGFYGIIFNVNGVDPNFQGNIFYSKEDIDVINSFRDLQLKYAKIAQETLHGLISHSSYDSKKSTRQNKISMNAPGKPFLSQQQLVVLFWTLKECQIIHKDITNINLAEAISTLTGYQAEPARQALSDINANGVNFFLSNADHFDVIIKSLEFVSKKIHSLKNQKDR